MPLHRLQPKGTHGNTRGDAVALWRDSMDALGLRWGALAILAFAGSACATAAADGSVGGAGGGGDVGPSTAAHGSSTTHAATASVTSTQVASSSQAAGPATTTGSGPSTSSGGTTCGSLPCDQCQSCALSPGGDCITQWNACAANSECGAFMNCISACPFDDPNTPGDEQLDCICSNDGTTCDGNLTPGTCIGDHSSGMNDYSAVGECIYTVACSSSCQ